MDALGERLRHLRTEINLLQKEVANQLGIKPQTYSRYENNSRVPDISTLIKLANYYDVTSDFLLGIDKPNIDKNMVLKSTSQIKKDILALEKYINSCK